MIATVNWVFNTFDRVSIFELASAAGQNALATGQGVANTQMMAGNAIAQGQLAQGQASANAANSVSQGAQNAWLMYMLTKGKG